ncbi:YhgE/Pip domain-containing protein [Radiobacillus deserti]|uniref:YhgE/Pip domain-containing protein n=1 Tax=Radiobacillus deserti TaxID=2594883 RepID=A0A516KDQ5_9BACI|nr:YhgE/Pip domain-containing protein [Radiobacillus deserti]QDP39497.1 YhgE/Pip domain-containing protein [Radiobacillus deserti]
MIRIRKVLLVFLTIMLVLPSLLVSAASDEKDSKDEPTGKGSYSSKDEVVYGKLTANGDTKDAYVVNVFHVEEAGQILDYGSYTTLKNLTNTSELVQTNNQVEFAAPEGKFYYQGNMNEQPLPWDITITYLLDGKEIEPEALAGKDGHVKIIITTSENEDVDSVFFENYLLQVSLSLNLDLFQHIEAPDGMLANAGKNKQVSFTVMPEKEEKLVVEADVVDFELQGIDISAVPSSMPIDSPNIENMTGDLETLSDAIQDVNDGVAELENGVVELNNGVKELRSGSAQYKDGMSAIDASSSELVNGSQSIRQALEQINASLANSSEDMNMGDMKQLGEQLEQIANSLQNTSKDLSSLKESYAKDYGRLSRAIEDIPNSELTQAEKNQLYSSSANRSVVDQLIQTHEAAQAVKETYFAVKQNLAAVTGKLEKASASLTTMARNLEGIAGMLTSPPEGADLAQSLSKLQGGIDQLASQYRGFHSGLIEYTGGVHQLSSSYVEMHQGISQLAGGTGELENGVSELHDGTSELAVSTNDLPNEMKKEVNEMMAKYDNSDFKAVSFVSPKNEKINSVQFVLKTESIEQEEKEETEEAVEEEKGFWDKLLDLFR